MTARNRDRRSLVGFLVAARLSMGNVTEVFPDSAGLATPLSDCQMTSCPSAPVAGEET